MKPLFVVLLVVLVLLLALPIGMGHGDCPMCTSGDLHLGLGLCAAIFSVFVLVIARTIARLHLANIVRRRMVIDGSIYRPPRFV